MKETQRPSSESEIRTNAQVSELMMQLNGAAVRAANLAGELAVAQAKIEELEKIVQMKSAQ